MKKFNVKIKVDEKIFCGEILFNRFFIKLRFFNWE